MVKFLTSKLDKRSAKLVSAANNNVPSQHNAHVKKPDIQYEQDGRKVYLDIGISKDPKAYYKHKTG